MDIAREVNTAEKRIRRYIRETPLEHSVFYSERFGAKVYFKLENLQHTGSFKFRGAMNKLLSMTEAERSRGFVTASTGNHGAAFAFGLGKVDAGGVVFVPEHASPTKVDTIKHYGAEVRCFGNDCAKTEDHARRFAEKNGLTYMPPYNDIKVIGGQGTIAVELAKQLEQIEAVFVSLGGGGMVSGIAGYLKSVHPEAQIIGCSPENSPVMIQSVKAGKILDLPSLPTISDGTAGGVESGSITFDLCRQLVDDYITVTEDEITTSLRDFMQSHHMLIEGAAAAAIAAFVKQADRFKNKHVVVVICGANISMETLRQILIKYSRE